MRIGSCGIKIIYGDITDMAVDAIVNAANNKLLMGGGVAGAIKRKGGASIEDEAVKKGPIEIGQAAATSAGTLKARYVIHAATMGLPARLQANQHQAGGPARWTGRRRNANRLSSSYNRSRRNRSL